MCFSDSSFANNDDHTTQIGYIILLVDKYKKCNIIHFKSHKSRRVTRSVLGGETLAFADAFDTAYMIKRDLEEILKQNVPLKMLTDSKSLFDVITRSSQMSEKRLMIDIAGVREAYRNMEICDIGHIRTANNPADAMTKLVECNSLNRIISSAICDVQVDQWVIRDKVVDAKGGNVRLSC